jgi:hypothetical protein
MENVFSIELVSRTSKTFKIISTNEPLALVKDVGFTAADDQIKFSNPVVIVGGPTSQTLLTMKNIKLQLAPEDEIGRRRFALQFDAEPGILTGDAGLLMGVVYSNANVTIQSISTFQTILPTGVSGPVQILDTIVAQNANPTKFARYLWVPITVG